MYFYLINPGKIVIDLLYCWRAQIRRSSLTATSPLVVVGVATVPLPALPWPTCMAAATSAATPVPLDGDGDVPEVAPTTSGG